MGISTVFLRFTLFRKDSSCVPMIMNMNEKGRQTKLLAAIAIIAMVVCAIAVAMPSEEVSGVTTEVTPGTVEGSDLDNLQVAINNAADGDILVLKAGNYGSTEKYTKYTVDKSITIRAADPEDKPVIYGGFAVTADGCVFENICIYPDGEGATMKSGIAFYGNAISITGCEFDLGTENLANGIALFPRTVEPAVKADYKISGNSFIGFENPNTGGWGSSAILIAENYSPLTNYFDGVTEPSGASGLTAAEAAAIVYSSNNTFEKCTNVFDITDYTDYDKDTTTPEINYSMDEETGDIIQNNLSIAVGETYTVRASEAYDTVKVYGTLIVNGTLNAGTITVADDGKLSVGTNGKVNATDSIVSAAKNLDAISSVTFYGGSASGNVTLVGTLDGFTGSTVYMYTDDYSGDFNFAYTEGTDAYAFNVGAVDSFNGTIGIVQGGVTIAQISVVFEGGEDVTANSIRFTYESDAWSVDVTGTAVDKYTIDVNGDEEDGEVEVIREYSATVTGVVLRDYNGETDGGYATVNLNNVMLGTMTLVNEINVNGATVGNGDVLTLDEGAKINVEDSTSMFVLGSLRTPITSTDGRKMIENGDNNGTVYTMNYNETRHFVKSGDTGDLVAINGGTITIDLNETTDAEAQAILASADVGQTVVITNSADDTDTLIITGTLDLNGITISIPKENDITIQIGKGTQTADRASVSMNNVTFYSNGTDSEIQVQAGSALDITNSLLFVVVDAADGSTVNVDNDDVVYQNTSSQVSVGYGTTLTLTGNVTSVVDVYGTLVIESTATVPAGTEMTVYKGGNVVVDGTLTILGTATFEIGSDAEINGTVTVGQYSTGGAALNVAGNFTIAETGNVTIAGVAADNVNKNELNAPASEYIADEDAISGFSYPYMFEVYGTLAMNGTMSGYVHDHGIITISGVSESATIVLYSGVDFTVTSVDGILAVTDEGVLDSMLRTGQNVSDGNIVNLTNVRNVSISVSYDRYDYTVGTQNYRNYRTVMAVSGEVITGTGMTGTVELAGNPAGVQTDKDGSTAAAYINVVDETTLSFGINVNFTINADLVVDGDVVFIKATGTGIEDKKSITGNGSVTVNGLMTTSNNAVPAGIDVTAVKYTISTTGANATITDYYTNFADAVTAAPDADRDTINVMGTVKVSTDVTIPAGVIVQIENNGAINVAEGVTLILSDGATMNGSSTTKVIVDGTFTAQDYAEDLSVRTIEADVMSTDGASRTWTSLANAIESGMTDITLNRIVVIDSDLTIPEGVTVTTNVAPGSVEGEEGQYSILVDDAKLTVDGTLAMLETSEGAIGAVGEDGEIVVNGVYYARIMASEAPAAMDNVAGAHFAIASGASTYFYVSNIEFAAETTSANDNLDGAIIIKGIVGAGDVTFTAAEGIPMNIRLQALTVDETVGAPENMTILTTGTVTLSGDVTLTIQSNTRMTGTVAALCGDGTSNASVQLTNVQNNLVIRSYSSEGATATDYYLAINGTYNGDLAVTAGTVTVYEGNITVPTGSTLNVATGAVLDVPANRTMTVQTNESADENPVIIAGTLELDNANGVLGLGTVEITGQLNANDGMVLTTTLRVSGTLTVAENEILSINGGTLVVGDRPSYLGEAATGAVIGTVSFNASGLGAILAYEGADLSGAQIDINPATGESDATQIEYVINGTTYATIYAYSSTVYTVGQIAVIEEIDLRGLDTNGNWYVSEDAATAGDVDESVTGNPMRNYDVVYAQFEISDVLGTISVGTGITMYIDGLTINNYETWTEDGYRYNLPVGTHTISIAANANYSIENATITFNGQTVQNGGTIEITADMNSFTLAASGATISDTTVVIDGGNGSNDMSLTDILLIVLVILIVIMAIIVALRLMRS